MATTKSPSNQLLSTSERPHFIEDDQAMSEEEKEEAFLDYMKHGYHHPSMTKEVEEKAALTELYLKSTIPIPDTLFEQQFNIDHLERSSQAQATKIFRKNKEAFSKHACDLGKSNGLEMNIPLTTTEPHIQKYVPIPHTVRDQVKLILDQMEEFGIIRECNEPSIFCSNLLVTKKERWKKHQNTLRRQTNQQLYPEITHKPSDSIRTICPLSRKNTCLHH